MAVRVIIPGFGTPYLEKKLEILDKNAEILQRLLRPHLSIHIDIFNYTPSTLHLESRTSLAAFRVREHVGPGFLGQFLYRHAKPRRGDGLVIVLLDDVELHKDTDWTRLLYHLYRSDAKWDLLSPSLTRQSKYSYELMRCPPTKPRMLIRESNFVELFAYIMTGRAYARYHSLLDHRSCRMWGVDLLMSSINLKMGIVDAYPMRHYFAGTPYGPDAPDPYAELERIEKERGHEMIQEPLVSSVHRLVRPPPGLEQDVATMIREGKMQ